MTRASFRSAVPTAAAAWLLASLAAAHHSTAAFDLDGDLRLEGVVTRFEWANPHVYIGLAVDNAAGEPEVWNIEAEAPAAISLLGWTADSLTPGDRVTVEAKPARRPGRRVALGVAVVKADGTRLGIDADRSPPPPGTVTDRLSGLWLTVGAAIIGEFLDPTAAFELTPEGASAVARYTDAENPGQDCVAEPIPFAMIWPTLKRIDVGEARVVIRDSLGIERTVHMNVGSHAGVAESVHGHSIGHWEGDVLVIDTARFAGHRRGNAWGLPSSTRKHLVERFALNPDRTSLSYTFELEDPVYLTAPYTGSLTLNHRPELPFIDEPCDLEIARRYLN